MTPFSAWKMISLSPKSKFEHRVGMPMPRLTIQPSSNSIASRSHICWRVRPLASLIARSSRRHTLPPYSSTALSLPRAVLSSIHGERKHCSQPPTTEHHPCSLHIAELIPLVVLGLGSTNY